MSGGALEIGTDLITLPGLVNVKSDMEKPWKNVEILELAIEIDALPRFTY